MIVIVYLFSFLIFFYLTIKSQTAYLIVIIFCVFFLKFLLAKIYLPFTGASGPLLITGLIAPFPSFFINLNSQKSRVEKDLFIKLALSVILILLYFALSEFYKDLPSGTYLGFISHYFYYIITFVYIVKYNNRINFHYITRFLTLILFIQLILAIAQNILPHSVSNFFRVPFYEWNGAITHVISISMWKTNLINGSLLHPGIFASLLSLLLVFVLGVKISKLANFKSLNYYIFLFISLLIIASSGNRTSIISAMTGILIILYYYNRKLAFLSLLSLIILIGVSNSIYQYYMLYSNSEIGYDNPIIRLTSLGHLIYSGGNLSERELFTLTRSTNLIEFIDEAPLFGTGNYWKIGYNELGFDSVGSSWSDAALLFHIVEFGLVGFIFLAIPFWIIISFIMKGLDKKSKGLVFAILVASIIQTVTDIGMFSAPNYTLLIILITSIKYLKKNEHHILY